VEKGSCTEDNQSLWHARSIEGPPRILFCDWFNRSHACDSAITASRNCFDPEFGLASPHRPDPWPKTKEELRHFHAVFTSSYEMAPLMDHDRKEHRNNEGKDANYSSDPGNP
jgi:hypothetical protein